MTDVIWYQNVFGREGYEIDTKAGEKAKSIAGWLNFLSQTHTILSVQMTTGAYTIVVVETYPMEIIGLEEAKIKVEMAHLDWKVGMSTQPPLFSEQWNKIPGE